MTKYRAIRNTKHRVAKAIRRVRRTGDDWADSSNKKFIEADRQRAKEEIEYQLREIMKEPK